MSEIILGKKPQKKGLRDATHVAVIVAEADIPLSKGTRVGFDKGSGRAGPGFKPHIGIVDPFLDTFVVEKGKLFNLCLFPGSVTGLRHVYEHPAIDGPGATTSADWIKKWADQEGIEFNALMEHAQLWVNTAMSDNKYHTGEYWSEGGRFEGLCLPDLFWDHYDIVMGT